MALGALALPDGNVGFDGQGTAMVPVTAGENKVGTIAIKSPLETFKETFSEMKESLANMVGIQTEEAKRQAFHDQQDLKQRSFENEQANKRFDEAGMQGPALPTLNNDLDNLDTDKKETTVEAFEGSILGAILGDLKDAFDKVSFGEKMMAVVLGGGFLLFSKYKDKIVEALTPVVQFIMDLVDEFGPGKVFAGFIAGFVLLKSGLASKAIKGAGGLILKGIKASAAAIDKQGGILKAMGNGFERINKGAKGLVGSLSKAGSTITGGLTKGFNLLGKGLTSLRLGIMSMSSSLGAMIVPFLPVIAIAAAAVAIFFSLKSGFETFKESLDNGDSMFTAVIKGLGDAMLTLVTLPYVLIQKLTGYIAGLFGFDNFKEKLESFDIKEQIVNALGSLVGGLVKVLKGVAKGAAAALAAVFTFDNPVEAFSKAYAAVMAGGEGESAALQGSSDFQGDQSQKDFNDDSAKRDKVKGYNNMDTSEMGIGGDEGVGTGNATAMSYYAKQEEDRRYRDLGTGPKSNLSADDMMRMKGYTVSGMSDSQFDDATGYDLTDAHLEKFMAMVESQEFKSKVTKREVVRKNGKVVSDTGNITVIKGGPVTGDTINQSSTTQVTGDLDVNNTEFTQKMLNDAF